MELFQSSYCTNFSLSDPSDFEVAQDDSDQDSPQSIMAICTDGSRCGAAVYKDSITYLVADRKDPSDPYKGVDIIIQRTDPKVVIVSSVQKKLIDFIEKRFKINIIDLSKKDIRRQQCDDSTAMQSSPTNDQDQLLRLIDTELGRSELTLAIVPNIWFSMSSGMQKLIDSDLVRSKNLPGPEEKMLFITSRVEKSIDVCAIRSISALDRYITDEYIKLSESSSAVGCGTQPSLQRTMSCRSLNKNEGEPADTLKNLMPIIEVKYLDPGPILSMDRFTFESLGIFQKIVDKSLTEGEPHWVDTESELLPSLYEVLNRCCSIQGKRQLHSILSWPLQDIDELRNRHEALEYFMKPENKLIRDLLATQLKVIVPLNMILTKLNQSVGTYRDLSKIYKSLWAFFAIIDLIKGNPGHNLQILSQIENLDSPDLRTFVDSIVTIVDFEASRRENRIQVCPGIDNSVDEKKDLIQNLTKYCDDVALEETAKYKDIIGKTIQVCYLPRIGFLASTDYTSISELNQIRSSKFFDVLMHTESTVYFKTKRMEDCDNRAGDVACDLIDVQENVVVELQTELLKHTDTILELMELCGKLDCLIGFSIVSLERGFNRPEFVSAEQGIEILQGYHPLQTYRRETIPNNVRFYNEASQRSVKVMVITGPNSCGKTTYMKAACLVVYMAHIGCFVPAKHARLPIMDAILTRMHSANSISTGLSSFATDLHQINYALGRSTERSLIAIDEFGKGTQARDGFHLLRALVIHFASKAHSSPYVMVTTHYNRLVNHLQNYSEYILYKTFKVSRDQTKDTYTYEYKVVDGVGEISLADNVAALAGVPLRVIERAKEIRNYITEGRIIKPSPPSGA